MIGYLQELFGAALSSTIMVLPFIVGFAILIAVSSAINRRSK